LPTWRSSWHFLLSERKFFSRLKLDSGLNGLIMRSTLSFVVLTCTACLLCSYSSAQVGSSAASSPQAAQSIDGGAGPCAVTLTVTSDSKPVVAADVRVHIEYGFAGIRRLDLEAYTGNDGKVQFTGLPSRVHKPPLQFRASKDNLTGTAVYNPDSECKAAHEIVLTRQKQGQD